MRVEEGQSQTGCRCCFQTHHSVRLDLHCLRVEGAAERHRCIPEQEGGSRQCHESDEFRRLRYECAKPCHPGTDKQRVRQRADETQNEDVLAQQPLTQDKSVLRTDGDDE